MSITSSITYIQQMYQIRDHIRYVCGQLSGCLQSVQLCHQYRGLWWDKYITNIQWNSNNIGCLKLIRSIYMYLHLKISTIYQLGSIFKYIYTSISMFSSNGMECLLLQASSQMRKPVLVMKAMCASYCHIQVLQNVKIIPHFTMTRSTYP